MNALAETNSQVAKLHGLLPLLRQRIRGQDHVLPRIVSLLQRGELGLTKGLRPRGSFLFLGPTGVGKTEVTLNFTQLLCGEDRLFRFDMSEYQNQESLAVLLGGKLGERGTLALAVEKSNTGTLLFDEIEKAHPRVLDVFLQILDAARVTMASGETLDLSGFYVVFTSNIASAEIVGLQHSSFSTMERHVLGHAQQSMCPELYARITEKLVQQTHLRRAARHRATPARAGTRFHAWQRPRTYGRSIRVAVPRATWIPSPARRASDARCGGEIHRGCRRS